MKIAVMPGDYVGKEVVAEGLKLLQVASKKFNFKYEPVHYSIEITHASFRASEPALALSRRGGEWSR